MHEISLAQSLCAAVAESAREHAVPRVIMVRLAVGQDCLVMPNALRFAFDLLKPDPLMTDAALDMAAVPGHGFQVYAPERVPAGDGGLALGQAVSALWRWSRDVSGGTGQGD